MGERMARAALVVLAASGAVLGAWAAFAPRGFYDDFPGGGRSWVAADGPYNEHLVRDFGAMNLALTVATIVAIAFLGRATVLAAAGGWLTFQVPHLAYHLRHLDVLDGGDQVAVVALLVGTLVLPVVALAAVARGEVPAESRRHPVPH